MIDERLSRFTLPAWLKWLLGIISLLLVMSVIFGIYLYQAIQDNRTAGFEDVQKQVLQETDIRTINKIQRYHGEKAYYTIYGEANEEKALIVFYPFDGNQSDIMTVNQSDMVAKETIIANWNDQCTSCTMRDIVPAVISENGEEPAWELTYEDQQGRYVMEYFSFFNGKSIEVQRFNRMFDEE
ncbi:cell wall elongation regulator TseB-like domain-containing protein [Lentibacillus salinarum]|uniref:DUF5590 domain-containing protein n=1 Tax=Lentibacillus salinarum TaxID=446820 RepID=A0ABW3ZR48_9BACI